MTTKDELTIIEGMQIDRGYYSPYFVSDVKKMVAEYEDCRLLLVDKNITGAKEILGQLKASINERYPLLILAESIDQEALATLIVNKLRASLKVIAVKAPGFGDRKTHYLEDIAILTGGTLVRADLGMRLENMDHSILGLAAKVIVDKSTCTIVGDGTNIKSVNARVQQIKTLLGCTETGYEKDKLNERLARLTRGVGIISVGAQTETEMNEKILRVEDALCATRAAVAEGFVPGGGSTLLRLANQLDATLKEIDNEEQMLGVSVVKKALAYPLRIIVVNAGANASEIELKIANTLENIYLGYNVVTDTLEDLVVIGVIDPTKVLRCVIKNAISVARTFIFADAIICEISNQNNSRYTISTEKVENLY